MKFPTMFRPIQIGNVMVPNRFVVPPMGNILPIRMEPSVIALLLTMQRVQKEDLG